MSDSDIHGVVVYVTPSGRQREDAGVIVATTGKFLVRFRRDLPELDPENSDFLDALVADVPAMSDQLPGLGLIDYLVDCASSYITVSDRERLPVRSLEDALTWYYHRNVHPPVRRFQTHLPVYSVQAAAGRWGPERDFEAEPEDWIEAPESVRKLTGDMFLARVTGHSMEPLIADGSLCLFRGGAALGGSRNGKRLLIVNASESGDQRFTVKEYESRKHPDGSRRTIFLHPLNPAFPSWELESEPSDQDPSGRVRVVGEFVCIVDA